MLQYCRYMPCLYLETILEYCKVIFFYFKKNKIKEREAYMNNSFPVGCKFTG